MSHLHPLIDKVTFRVNHRELSKENVNGLSLLNYRELDNTNGPSSSITLNQAELAMYYDTSRGTPDVTKCIVHCE